MVRRGDLQRNATGRQSASAGGGFFSGRGQSVMETSVLFVILFFALLAMMVYTKRAVQGRLRGDAGGIGEQYDFWRSAGNMSTRHSSHVTTQSSTQDQMVTDPWTGWATDRQVTTSVSQTDYDISNTTGREVVMAP